MFRMRRTSSSAVNGADADEQPTPTGSPWSAEAGARLLAVERLREVAAAVVAAAAAAALTAALLAVAPGARNKGPARRRTIPARPRLSISDMLCVSRTSRVERGPQPHAQKPEGAAEPDQFRKLLGSVENLVSLEIPPRYHPRELPQPHKRIDARAARVAVRALGVHCLCEYACDSFEHSHRPQQRSRV